MQLLTEGYCDGEVFIAGLINNLHLIPLSGRRRNVEVCHSTRGQVTADCASLASDGQH